MVDGLDGAYDGSGLSVGIVVSDVNDRFTRELQRGAVETLRRCGTAEEDVTVYRAPGAFELPALARRVYERRDHDGLICLGVVIRGDTPHFDYISSRVTRGVGTLADEADIPVTFGVLTTDTVEQARDRSGAKAGNKGREAALAMLQMVSAFQALDG